MIVLNELWDEIKYSVDTVYQMEIIVLSQGCFLRVGEVRREGVTISTETVNETNVPRLKLSQLSIHPGHLSISPSPHYPETRAQLPHSPATLAPSSKASLPVPLSPTRKPRKASTRRHLHLELRLT